MIIGWILFSFIAGTVGAGRRIGFFGALFFSLILAPMLRLIIALFSKTHEQVGNKLRMPAGQQAQTVALKQLNL